MALPVKERAFAKRVRHTGTGVIQTGLGAAWDSDDLNWWRIGDSLIEGTAATIRETQETRAWNDYHMTDWRVSDRQPKAATKRNTGENFIGLNTFPCNRGRKDRVIPAKLERCVHVGTGCMNGYSRVSNRKANEDKKLFSLFPFFRLSGLHDSVNRIKHSEHEHTH